MKLSLKNSAISLLATLLLTACGGGSENALEAYNQDANPENLVTYDLAIPLKRNPNTFECIKVVNFNEENISKSRYYIDIDNYYDTKSECETKGAEWIGTYTHNDTPATPEQKEALDYFNAIRKNMGLVPLKYDKRLEKATLMHQLYGADVLEKYNVYVAHRENNESYPSEYYTGVYPWERAKRQGFGDGAGEVLTGFSPYSISTSKKSLHVLLTALYHRLVMFRFKNNKVGIAYPYDAILQKYGLSITMMPHLLGNEVGGEFNRLISPEAALYPYDGQTDVQTTYNRAEIPEPLVNSGIMGYSGNPISVQLNPSRFNDVTLVSFKLYYDENGTEVPAFLLTAKNDPHGEKHLISELDFALFPIKPMLPNTTYRAEFVFKDDNAAQKSYTWRFTTENGEI